MAEQRSIWVFMGEGARFPAGIFSNQSEAERSIQKYQLSGVLTECLLDEDDDGLSWHVEQQPRNDCRQLPYRDGAPAADTGRGS